MQNNWHILIVDVDRDIHRMLNEKLRSAGLEVTNAYDGQRALDSIDREGLPHLAIIDIELPDTGRDGLDLAKDLFTRSVPIIMTTTHHTPQKALESLRVADDYVRKPLEPDEIVARVRRILSRISDFSYARSPLLEIDDRLQFDYANQALIVDGKPVSLTPIESRLLHTLMQNKGRVVDSRTIIARVWNSDNIFEDTLRVHIHRLRAKLELDPRHPKYILTERGVGYSFHS
jgi:DNA-binding response OmpR family regulator